MIAVGLWGLTLEPGKRYNVTDAEFDVQLSGATYGETVNGDTRSVIKVQTSVHDESDEEESDDEDEGKGADEPKMKEVVLCSLIPGKIEYQALNLILNVSDDLIVFEVTGTNTVYLSGNYVEQHENRDMNDMDDFEDDYDLSEVPSDIDLDSDEYAAVLNGEMDDDEDELEEGDQSMDGPNITEIVEEIKVSKKRPREDDEEVETTANMSATITTTEGPAKLSKAEKKRLKKLKAESGEAVAPPHANGVESSPAGKESKVEEKREGKKDKEKKKDKAGPKSLPGGVLFEDMKLGTGPTAKTGKKVGMRYIGKLLNGKVFDSNTKGKPFEFVLGKGDVIKGWDEGILGMAVGGERKITVPPAKAYGSKATGDIPPNSTLIFEVKMVSIN